MIFARRLPSFILFYILEVAALAGLPTLTMPENKATDQPADLTLSWEAGALTNYISDGGFEKGGQNWSLQTFWKVTTDAANAYEGTRFAELPFRVNNVGPRGEVILFQRVTLPKKGSDARLQWVDYHSTTGEPDTRAHFKVDVFVTTSGADEVVHDVICGEGSIAPWNPHEVDLSQYLGKSIILTYSITNQFSQPRSCVARVDDVRLEVTPESVEYEVYLGSTANLGAAQLLGKTTDASWNLSGLAAASTNYWKVIQITDGTRVSSPVFQFVVGGSVPVDAPPLLVELGGGQLHLHATTQVGGFYQLEQADDPESGSWQPIGDEITGDGAETSVDVPLDAEARFFRLRVTR